MSGNAKVAVSPERLREFFHPRNVALIGATDKSMWSVFTYKNLNIMNFSGEIYCVNPNRDVVHGQKAYHSLLDIEDSIDLAYVMVPSSHIMQVMKEAAEKKIRNLVLLTAGFSELGEAGQKLEQELLAFAKEHDQLILGPNGNGFVNVTSSLTPYGLPITPPLKAGPVGVVLQSGALASSIMTLAQVRNVGLSFLVAMGNETMISATDIIDYLIEDDSTKVIALFLESIRQPEEFARVAKKALQYGKPVVALKIGRSEKSAHTAMAHTGALVGDDAVNDAAFRQLGVIRVNSLEDLLTTAGLLGYTPPLFGRRMGVVTPSGGACDILSDRSADEKIELPEFSPQTVQALKEIVPSFSTVHNPLDVTGYVVVDRTLMRRALAAVSRDPELDFIISLVDPPRVEPEDVAPVYEQYEELSKIVNNAACPVILVMNTSLEMTPFGQKVADKYGLHFVGGMEHGLTALGKAVWWNEKYRATKAAAANKAHPVAQLAVDVSGGEWSEYQARKFLEEHGVPVVPGLLATKLEDALAAAEKVGYPVAMKIQSEDIAHKSDIGGVKLGLASAAEVADAYQEILENVQKRAPGSRIEGMLVSPMRPPGTELLVGIVNDPLWGLVLAVGIGGVFVEVFKDTSLRVLPVERDEIRVMLEELRGIPLLKGTRGRVAADLEKVTDAIYKVSQLAFSAKQSLQELEINPLWVNGGQVEALDALMKWKQTDRVVSQ
ncbi:acetate--CoA ligase family protein [Brevibacillus centrosporus]|uniref:acetate--CoA ligase family protein n=1 Tax=Brevibacillus centrosporus TaxID=54910 RepID=UPI0011759FCB|nr:acetate--CoA ligase family protein [Brevibacillus centrosporus]MEC2131308.1 acetate--CoA ligase family protein [Brevibacillus centrosporus]GED31517.1 acyl-CoA synthetase [Brevibacillus centrosporus]